jgi:RimJ/RimL family protein N-acetyltransferase
MHLEALEPAKTWRKYARRAAVGGMVLDLVPLEESHRSQMEAFQDRLDAETVYLRHGSYFSAGTRKSTAWLEKQWNKPGQDGFSQGAFLNGRLIGIGSLHELPGGKSAEVALVVVTEFQGLGRGGEKGVGGLLLEDLIRYAQGRQLEQVTAYLAVHNPRCERLLRKCGFEISVWSYWNHEDSATLDLRHAREFPRAAAHPLAERPMSISKSRSHGNALVRWSRIRKLWTAA